MDSSSYSRGKKAWRVVEYPTPPAGTVSCGGAAMEISSGSEVEETEEVESSSRSKMDVEGVEMEWERSVKLELHERGSDESSVPSPK